MKKTILLLILLFAHCAADIIPIDIEYAKSKKERSFGLMQRSELPNNSGMLFIYPEKKYIHIWMFNCLIDLSVAFLDEDGIIREMHNLKAHPELMKQFSSITKYEQLVKFVKTEAVPVIFYDETLSSSFKASYALEMNYDWFYTHLVTVGDKLVWKNLKQPYIKKK